MLDELFAPMAGVSELILRLTLGILFLPHGWQKLKAPSELAGLLRQLGVPAPLFAAWSVALLESVGAVLVMLGVATRLLSLGLAIDMLVAIVSVRIGKAKASFVTTQQGTGWDLEFALLGGALALVFAGAGRLGSTDFSACERRGFEFAACSALKRPHGVSECHSSHETV
ncbi:MAG TPA: DoxX family protein [Candidatus Angelobacter sp.]|nr:DoxX family protein [Candidatus Angelobacter sp.]